MSVSFTGSFDDFLVTNSGTTSVFPSQYSWVGSTPPSSRPALKPLGPTNDGRDRPHPVGTVLYQPGPSNCREKILGPGSSTLVPPLPSIPDRDPGSVWTGS